MTTETLFTRHFEKSRRREFVSTGVFGGDPDAITTYGRIVGIQGRHYLESRFTPVLELHRKGSDATGNSLLRFRITGALQQGSPPEWTDVDGEAVTCGMLAQATWGVGDHEASGGLDSAVNRWFEVKGPDNNSVTGQGVFVREGGDYLRLRSDLVESTENGLFLESANRINSETIAGDTTGSAENMFVDSGDGRIRRSTSAARFKTDIEDADFAYSRRAVMEARPIWYRSKCDGDNPDWSFWGFTAEAVAEIDPRLVQWGYEREDYEQVQTGSRPIEKLVATGEVGDDGEPVEETRVVGHRPIFEKRLKEGAEMKPQGVAYSRYVVHLVNVAKAQEARIKTLEDRLAKLEAKL